MATLRQSETGLVYNIDGDRGDWLIFAHGGDGNSVCWCLQVAAFTDRFRCLTYDAPGFGLSPAGAGLKQTPADDLLFLMDEVGIERAALIGHSMGGLAVSGVAQRHPGRVRALAMSDTPFGFHTKALQRWASEMLVKIANGFQVLEHLFAPGFAKREPELYRLYQAICRIRLPAPLPKKPPDYSAAYIAMRDTAPADYSAFPVPTLFIVGDQDELTLPWLMETTAKAVGGARLEVIEGAGHSPFYEQAEAYNAVLAAFLDRAGRISQA